MSRCFDAIGTNEDAGGGTREWHGRDVRRRARYEARVAANRARARVRGKTGRVSAPRAVPTDSDVTKRHSAFRRDSSENPRFPNCRVVRFPRSTRVSTSRVPSWGVSCLCQPERGRSRAPSPRATSPERSFGATDRANPQKRFSPRPCAGVNLETENALAECVRNSVVGVPTGATDPQVSRRCRARLRVRPRRPEEWQARVARVRLTSQILTFTSAPGCLVSGRCRTVGRSTRCHLGGNFPDGSRDRGAVARHFDARTPRASRALPRANARARTRTARSALQEVRRTRAFLRDVSPRRLEARYLLGSGRLRRQSATRPHRRRGRARVGRRGGRRRRHG